MCVLCRWGGGGGDVEAPRYASNAVHLARPRGNLSPNLRDGGGWGGDNRTPALHRGATLREGWLIHATVAGM